MAEGFRPVTPERTLTGISVRVAQRKFRYRRPRVADLAVEVLVRTTIPPEGIEVPERFATVAAALRERGVFKSEQALEELKLRAARTLGIGVRAPGRPAGRRTANH